MKMEWDPRKAARNLSKHEVSFEEAATVFSNPLAVIFEDEWHSESEAREIIIGHSAINQLLVVVFVDREASIRIISARRATASEQNDYEENTYKK